MRLSAIARFAAFLLLTAAPTLLRAQAPVVPPPAMSPAELNVVYLELLYTHDGFLYTINLLGYPGEEAARKGWEQMQQPRFRVQRLDKIFKSITPRNFYTFQLDPAVRGKVVNLGEGQRTGPVATARGWVIAEMVSRRVAPAPGLDQVQSAIPAIVAGGGLPSASELLSNPALRRRTAANRIQTVEDLKAVPPDLDVNAKLSSERTLLLGAIARNSPELVAALLARGANPNQCAHRLCPLDSAIFGKASAITDLLLKAGADPNQNDPSSGVDEGPLSAAAYGGDIPLATRLIEAGAKVNGQGRGHPPLMAAASAANRPMTELLIGKGADLFAVTDTAPARGALDSAESSKNAEFAAWLRGVMRTKAMESGLYAWQGWIEQDGRRYAIDGNPIVLKKAPFRITVRMRPERMLYVSASSSPQLFEEFRKGGPDSALFSSMNLSAEGKEPNDLVVHEPQKPGARWGGSHAWWKDDTGSRFTSVTDTPQGREHAREIRTLVVIDASDKINDDIPVSAYKGASLYLVLGTRIHMTFMDEEVFDGRTVELKFD